LGHGTIANYGGGLAFNVLIGYSATDSGLENVIRIGTGQAPVPQANKVSIGNDTHTNVQIGKFNFTNGFARVQFSQTENKTVSNTVLETTLLGAGAGSLIIPAGSLVIGSIIRVNARGIISDTGTPTLQLRFKIGSTTYLDFGAVTFPTLTGTHAWSLSADITIRTIGASGTAIGNGIASVSVVGSPDMETSNTATSVIATTVPNTMELTVQWGTANASNSITATNVLIEVIG
jgi:hypothetical protein